VTALVTGQNLATVLQLTYASDQAAFDQVADAADEILSALLTTGVDHSTHSRCKEAALSIATELYQARTSVGGQPVSLDFTPGPYRLSAWLTRRVGALIGSCSDVGTMVG
jgi:hypothetical protein